MMKKPKRTQEEYLRRMYELWFEFLRRSEDYKEYCLTDGQQYKKKAGVDFDDLYANFGNVHAMDFSEWWENVRELVEPVDFTVDFIDSAQEAAEFLEDPSNRVLVVNLYAPTHELVKKFRELIKITRPPRKPGRPKSRDDVFAFFKLEGVNMNPKLRRRVEHLENCLYVYDHRHPEKKKAHYQLAIDCGLSVTHNDHGDPVNKKALTVASARLLDHAKKIISNAEKGKFPKYR